MSDSSPDSAREQQINEVIAAYLEAADAGTAPSREDLLAQYPELAAELALFLDDHEGVQRLARPLAAVSQGDTEQLQAASLAEQATLPPQQDRVETASPPVEQVTLPPTQLADATTLPPLAGSKVRYVGDYELLEELGRGGMGVVYRARQVSLKRPVALKMILSGGQAGEADLARFRLEAEAVARVRHEHIVQIHEIGEHEGLPYMALEYCPGGSLAARLDGTPWPARRAAGLVQVLARAMQAAHAAGVIHRDLKPANVLLTEEGTAKVTDFGLAKRFEPAPHEPSLRPGLGDLFGSGLTVTGAIMGTPSYMAPEQAGGQSKEVGPAADIYALGAILYELLTGRPPFRAARPLDTILQVVSEEPVAPSRLSPGLRRDLETICLKCLEKEPRKRYASAEELAEELGRFERGEPILARPVGRVERLAKWMKRHPARAGLIGTAVVLLLVLTIGGPLVALWQTELRRYAEDNAAYARKKEGEAVGAQKEAEREREDTRKALLLVSEARAKLQRQVQRTEAALFTAQLLRVEPLCERAPAHAWRLLHDYNACPIDKRDFAWRYYAQLCRPRVLTGHSGPVSSVAFGMSGGTLASGGWDGTVKLWDVTIGQEPIKLKGHGSKITSVALSADGKKLASASGDTTVKLWDAATGQVVHSLNGHATAVAAVAFSVDGQTLATGGGQAGKPGEVKLWDVATGRQRAAHIKGHPHPVRSVAFSPDGTTLASASWDGTVKLWDTATGQERVTLTGQGDSLESVAFSPNGKTVASGGQRLEAPLPGQLGEMKGPVGVATIWDIATGRPLATLFADDKRVTSVAFSPDARSLATAGGDGRVRLWDIATGQERSTLSGHHADISCVAFSGDGKILASASQDRTVRLWRIGAGQERATLEGHADLVLCVAPSSDGKTLASVGREGVVKLWDVATGTLRATLGKPTSCLREATPGSLAFSPDGKTLAAATNDRTVVLWRVDTSKVLRTLTGFGDTVNSLAFSPDGRTLASAAARLDGRVMLWDLAAGQPPVTLYRSTHSGPVRSVAFSPDGKSLAAAAEYRTVLLWDLPAGTLRTLEGHGKYVFCVAFSKDGKTLASAGVGAVRLWDATTGREHAVLRGHTGSIRSVAFSADSKTLASASDDMTVKVWDTLTGQARATLKGHTGVVSVAFAVNDTILASAGDRAVKLWDVARDLQPRGVLTEHARGVRSVAFSIDGKTLKTNDYGNVTYYWDMASGKRVAARSNESFSAASSTSPLGNLQATADRHGTITLREVKSNQVRSLLRGHTGAVTAMAFSPDGQTLASGGPDGVLLWDVALALSQQLPPGRSLP